MTIFNDLDRLILYLSKVIIAFTSQLLLIFAIQAELLQWLDLSLCMQEESFPAVKNNAIMRHHLCAGTIARPGILYKRTRLSMAVRDFSIVKPIMKLCPIAFAIVALAASLSEAAPAVPPAEKRGFFLKRDLLGLGNLGKKIA